MGMVFPGIPKDITLRLAEKGSTRIFIETGTYKGSTTRWAAGHFQKVFTIERSDFHFQESKAAFGNLKNVSPLFGDSRQVLPQVLSEIGNQGALLFLDGHWSGGQTAGEADECPLIDELKLLEGRKDDIILIDDARLFHAPPPLPHNPSHWPTIGEIVTVLQRCQQDPYIAIVDDVIFSLPRKAPVTDCFIEYARSASEKFWKTYQRGDSATTAGRKFFLFKR